MKAGGEGIRLDDEQRLAWLRLIRSENVGPVSFRQLINRFGSASAALEALPSLASRGGSKAIRIATVDQVRREADFAASRGARFIALGEPEYPAALAAADAPPPILAVLGSTETLTNSSVGVVGSRNSSLAGVKMCERVAVGCGRAGYTVVSGLARGIDAAAHRVSLATGTVACMAGGLDKPYPPENVPLMEDIVASGGALVSEQPFGWEPRSRDFPRRNRLIAGLSLAVIVIEAAHRSGSLITARLANEMGRLVFAVPGSPLDPRSAGANGLIKQGASILTDAEDVIDAIEPLSIEQGNAQPQLFEDGPADNAIDEPADGERERIVEALGPAPIPIDELQAHVGAKPGVVQAVLLELDLAGRLERHEGNYVSLNLG